MKNFKSLKYILVIIPSGKINIVFLESFGLLKLINSLIPFSVSWFVKKRSIGIFGETTRITEFKLSCFIFSKFSLENRKCIHKYGTPQKS